MAKKEFNTPEEYRKDLANKLNEKRKEGVSGFRLPKTGKEIAESILEKERGTDRYKFAHAYTKSKRKIPKVQSELEEDNARLTEEIKLKNEDNARLTEEIKLKNEDNAKTKEDNIEKIENYETSKKIGEILSKNYQKMDKQYTNLSESDLSKLKTLPISSIRMEGGNRIYYIDGFGEFTLAYKGKIGIDRGYVDGLEIMSHSKIIELMDIIAKTLDINWDKEELFGYKEIFFSSSTAKYEHKNIGKILNAITLLLGGYFSIKHYSGSSGVRKQVEYEMVTRSDPDGYTIKWKNILSRDCDSNNDNYIGFVNLNEETRKQKENIEKQRIDDTLEDVDRYKYSYPVELTEAKTDIINFYKENGSSGRARNLKNDISIYLKDGGKRKDIIEKALELPEVKEAAKKILLDSVEKRKLTGFMNLIGFSTDLKAYSLESDIKDKIKQRIVEEVSKDNIYESKYRFRMDYYYKSLKYILDTYADSHLQERLYEQKCSHLVDLLGSVDGWAAKRDIVHFLSRFPIPREEVEKLMDDTYNDLHNRQNSSFFVHVHWTWDELYK